MSDDLAAARADAASAGPIPAADLDRVSRALQGIRFGEVRVVIQDGLIVQIERLEKQRLR